MFDQIFGHHGPAKTRESNHLCIYLYVYLSVNLDQQGTKNLWPTNKGATLSFYLMTRLELDY